MSSPPAPRDMDNCNYHGFLALINCGTGSALNSSGQSVGQLVAALAASFASLGVQLLLFVILRLRLTRIYRPRSYLVPERERVPPPPQGIVGWLYPVFSTNNLALIQKCGLDAYFFLRFLRMLLKIFLPTALLALPILLPLNHHGGGGQTGLDTYSIANIGRKHTDRLWGHLILAILFISWFLYVTFQELRGYIRVRQAFLTSPQHRIRASATTVLVTGIPRKWLTLEALSGLYDVFPGGIRNIWINRNFDVLMEKVQLRDEVSRNLEDAETSLIKLCREKHLEAEAKRAKEEGQKKRTKDEKKQDRADEDAAAETMAHSQGTSAGEQHQIPNAMQDILEEEERQQEKYSKRSRNPFGVVGQSLGTVGKGIGRLGGMVAGGVDNGLHKVGDDLNGVIATANDGGIGGGFVADDKLYQSGADGASERLAVDSQTRTAHEEQNTTAADSRPATAHGSQIQTRHAYAASPVNSDRLHDSMNSDDTLGVPDIRTIRPSADSKPKESLQIEVPPTHQGKRKPWHLFINNDNSLALPSPKPHAQGDDEFPLRATEEKAAQSAPDNVPKSTWTDKVFFWKNAHKEEVKEQYPSAVDDQWDEDQDEEPQWRRFVATKDRETMLLRPISWLPIPFVGKKVDKVYHLRRELARLNLEIEADQNNVEKFPLMNSAFIQFNHQVAAHMCCQSLSHHLPQQMAPRLVEISPDDVLWDNMAMKWWERYLRTGIVLAISGGLILLYAIPVAFTSLLNKISLLAQVVPWLSWLERAPNWVQSLIEGILPPVLLSLLLLLVPIIFRTLIKQQGVATGNAKELGVQQWYFTFLFIQVFLVVTISGGLTAFFSNAASDPGSIVRVLATNLPKASNYFFSYLTVQALSNSASALLQVGSLFGWFILAPLLDSTARSKWRRQTSLNDQQWGTFFPPFTNFAAIGLVYSIISPLILVFVIFMFGLFWIVNRYNVLFVYRFTNDTGGLLFPTAINQLFTGIYFLELCLIGLFFTLTDEHGDIATLPQAIIMIIVVIATVTYQWFMNSAFSPLFRYLPITLEDEAVIRDEEFARAQASKFAPLREGEAEAEDTRDIQDVVEEQERRNEESGDAARDVEERDIDKHKRGATATLSQSSDANRKASISGTPQARWHDRKEPKPLWATDAWKRVAPEAVSALRYLADGKRNGKEEAKHDVEAQHTVGDVLFSGFADELEDLTPEDRDLLVRYAFQHSALRARRPVVWIPRDALGVSDDEIKRSKKMSTVKVDDGHGGTEEKTFIWMSNQGTALDGKGHVVFRQSPPDFSNVDLIAL